jgi:hypothetical protein
VLKPMADGLREERPIINPRDRGFRVQLSAPSQRRFLVGRR